jgi:hypothetical protein
MIRNIRKNIMGTVSFDGQFKGVRRPQDFIVYPMQDSGTRITIQSEHRFGRLDLASGKGVLSANRGQYANDLWLSICLANGTARAIQLEVEELQTLRQWVKSTGGLMVGESLVLSDNTGAIAL